ncbi:PLP-dependent aminotransferase family protein [Burkholderiaceae bacterium DAT-1]|nr:PLP-dependent aminotransferase family protein [Burkholderiaceae bacterium DAT-1]
MNMPSLYQRLAAQYRKAIESGTLVAGTRLPSLRELMARHEVSLSTAVEVYRLLEREDYIEARDRSGYFVKLRVRSRVRPAKEPDPAAIDPAQYVGINERVSRVIAAGQQALVTVDLAHASPSARYYPSDALQRLATRVMREDKDLFGRMAREGGEPALKSVLSRRAFAAQIDVSPDEIIVTHGGIEALNLALRAVTQTGDTVAIESPTFFGLLQIIESLGLKAVEIPTSPQTGMSIDALELAQRMCPGLTTVISVPNFHNPTGSVMPDEAKARLVQFCEQHGIALIEDDSYSVLGQGELPAASLKRWDRSGNVIHCASLHKTLSPGLRLGWMIAGKWQQRVRMLKYVQSRSNNALHQLVAAGFMAESSFDRHLKKLRGHLCDQRMRYAQAIYDYFPDSIRMTVPEGGIYLWIELPEQVSSLTLFEDALKKGIRLWPGSIFTNTSRFDHFIRLTYGETYSEPVDQAMRTLGRMVESASRA